MRLEIRRSAGDTCDSCGSYELVYAGGRPLASDLAGVMEREMLRREVSLLRLTKDHLARVTDEHVQRESEMAAEFVAKIKNERWRLRQEYEEQVAEVEVLLERQKVNVSVWRVVRKRREAAFAALIDTAIEELKKSTAGAT